MIPKIVIDQIFETARIEEVIGDFVQLKKRGVNLLGLCPFHNEKTPSFTVSPAKGIYKCFGCGKGGNSINFIMDHEHFNYPEALKYLATKYNIEFKEEKLTDEQLEKANEKDSLFVISSFANEYFQKQLWEKEGAAIGLSYFKERGYNEATIKKFQLGYSPKEKNAFSKHALHSSFDKNFLEKSGICYVKDGKLIDRFRERIIFPIHSFSGRVLGFGGRALNAKNKAKYVNSAENAIYHKSKILYGIYFAKQAISRENNCFIVEGYTDVISLYQKGVENVVSSSGTSLTLKQIKLISRFTKNITILFDGDAAGIKASFRSIDMILSEGMNVKVILFPDGEDPDSYSKKLTEIQLQEYLSKEAKDFISFKTNVLKIETENDPVKRVEIINDIVSSISIIPDYLMRIEYAKVCSNILNIQEVDLLKVIGEKRKKIGDDMIIKNNNKIESNQNENKSTKLQKLELELLRILFNYGNRNLTFDKQEVSVAEFIISEINIDNIEFSYTNYALVFEEVKKMISEKKVIDITFFTSHKNKIFSQLVIDLISTEHNISSNWQDRHKIFTGRESDKMKKTTEKTILTLKIEHVDKKIHEIQNELKINNQNRNNIKLLQQLIQIRKKIGVKIGRT